MINQGATLEPVEADNRPGDQLFKLLERCDALGPR